MTERFAGICGRFPLNRVPDTDIQKGLSDVVMDCYTAGIKHFLAGISGEFEQMAVRIVSELKTVMTDIKLTVVMTPCECSGYARYLSGKVGKSDIWRYVETADNFKTVKQDSRLTDYVEKHRYVVDRCERLICCYAASVRETETRHLLGLAGNKPALEIINLYELQPNER